MTYSTVLSARINDLDGFVSAWNDWGKEHVLSESQKALGASLSQMMLGGERAGEVNASFQWESIDDAMTGLVAMNQSSRLKDLYQNCGVTPLRRSMARIAAQRGTREGQYMSMLMVTTDPADDVTVSANADTMWDGLSEAANGYAINQVIAGGEFTGMYALIGWCDSLDTYMEAAADVNTSAPVQQLMSNQNIRFVSRGLARRLG